ncbi:multicopper oxidase family protein [Corynebacterium uberis]|uniref:multicopper oxidase family protein n=2 Tax=Corynebacterium TaxID=1716 RepID=UPI0037DDC2B7
MMNIQRRSFLKGAAFLAATVAAGPLIVACGSKHKQATPRGYDGARRALPIPPLLDGSVVAGVRTFDLHAGEAQAQILPDVTTPAWGFNGGHLGPTLHLRRGEQVQVNVHNGLKEMTTIHWHGMKLPAIADGGPHQPIEPGDSWSPTWKVEQPAATLWYHPHPHERTALHAYRGLAGLIVIDDDTSAKVDLPHNYGVDDIPVAIMDQKFNEDGTLNEESDPDLGLKGDTPTLNGITNAEFTATTRRVRLRLLDASTMRFFNLRFSDGRSFHVVATDSGLLDKPLEVDHLRITPGERAEIVVDLDEGKDLTLQATPFEDNFGVPDDEYTLDFGLQDSFDLLLIHGPESAPAPAALPAVLEPAAAKPLDINGAVEREFVLNTFEINGQSMDMSRVDLTIDRKAPEIWTVTNENPDWIHNFHIHDAAFKVLSMEGTDVDVFTDGWKDTVGLPPGATAKLAVTFGYYPDPKWAYMYHCHMLLHEDSGMMGQFVITEPGQKAALAAPMAGEHHHHGH